MDSFGGYLIGFCQIIVCIIIKDDYSWSFVILQRTFSEQYKRLNTIFLNILQPYKTFQRSVMFLPKIIIFQLMVQNFMSVMKFQFASVIIVLKLASEIRL